MKTARLLSVLLLFGLLIPVTALGDKKDFSKRSGLEQAQDRVVAATEFVREIMDSNKKIPPQLINNAEAIVVFTSVYRAPSLKNKKFDMIGGVMSVRHPGTRTWGAPIFVMLDGGLMEETLEDDDTEGDDGLIMLAMDRNSAAMLLGHKVNLKNLPIHSGPFVFHGTTKEDVPAASSGIFAYYRAHSDTSRWGSISGSPSIKSVLYTDVELNNAAYGQDLIDVFKPVSEATPGQLLLFSDLLNSLSKDSGV
jgi:hypothetical protein